MTWIFSGVGITIITLIIYIFNRNVRHLKFKPSNPVMGYECNQIALPLRVNKNVQDRVHALVTQEKNRFSNFFPTFGAVNAIKLACLVES